METTEALFDAHGETDAHGEMRVNAKGEDVGRRLETVFTEHARKVGVPARQIQGFNGSGVVGAFRRGYDERENGCNGLVGERTEKPYR